MSFFSNAQALAAAWLCFESNCQFSLSSFTVQSLDDNLVIEAAKQLGDVKELAGDAWCDNFSQVEVSRIHKIIRKLYDEQAVLSLLDEAVEKNRIELPSIFSDGTVSCTGSFQVGVRNFVRFVDKNESFYLIQHHRFFRGLYFPLRRLLFCPDQTLVGGEIGDGLDREVLRLLPKLSVGGNSEVSNFLGLTVSYPRPYHFFYDLMPVVFSWCSERPDILRKLPGIVQLTDGDFLSAKDFYKFNCEEHKFSSFQKVNDCLVENNGFLLQPGYVKKRITDYTKLDQALREYSLRCSVLGRDLVSNKKEDDIAVWVGICAEKRSWLEARFALQQFISRLSANYDSVKIVVDGLTATSSDTFSHSYENEASLLRELSALVPTNVEIISLLGATAVDKIAVAQGVDFFLTSFLTDSMYVARFGKKKGVAHGANAATYFDHLHVNTFFVPKIFVSDSLSGNKGNWAKISYSIDPGCVVDYCFEVMGLSSCGEIDINYLSDASGCLLFSELDGSIYFKTNARYCSVNDMSVNFNRCGDAPYAVSPGSLYQFYLDGVKSTAGGDISLVVISHSNGKRLSTDFVRLGTHKDVIFPPQAETFRLFFRLSGGGVYKLPRVRMVSLPYQSTSQPQGIVRRNVHKWPQTVYEYNDCEEFIRVIPSGIKTGIHAIRYHDVFLEFNFYNLGYDNLVVFFNAAVTRTINTELPVFSGSKAIGNLKANILMVNDPCLYLDDNLSLAWYVGSRTLPLQLDLSVVLSELGARYGKRSILFYGGSGGGFASLYYSSKVKDAIAICCNPQTSIADYDKASVERYMSVCFEGGRADQANKFLSESGFTGLLGAEEFKSTNRVIYLQNKNDGHHFKRHFQPFLARIGLAEHYRSDKNVQILSDSFSLVMSSEWGEGHAAAPKEVVYGLLQVLLEDSNFLKYNEVEAENLLAASESKGYQFIRSCTLTESNGKLIASADIDVEKLNGKPSMAWYLYHNGLRIITTKYTDELVWEVDCRADGVYWVVGFLKCKSIKQNLRSNKLNLELGGRHD